MKFIVTIRYYKHIKTMQCLQANLRDLQKLLSKADDLELSHDARKRLKWFIYALEHEGNVSLTCRYFGIARSTFISWAKRFSIRDPYTLEERSRSPHSVRQQEVPEHVVAIIEQYRRNEPLLSKQEIAKRLFSEHGVTLSASSVGRTITRFALFFADTASHREKRKSYESRFADAGKVAHEERPEEDIGGSVVQPKLGLLSLALLSFCAAGSFISVPEVTHAAAESASFTITDDYSSHGEQSPSSSSSFQLRGGITWQEQPVEGASFQIVPDAPVQEEVDAGGAGGEDGGDVDTGDTGSTGGPSGGCRRGNPGCPYDDGHGAAPEEPEVPTEPEVPSEPEAPTEPKTPTTPEVPTPTLPPVLPELPSVPVVAFDDLLWPYFSFEEFIRTGMLPSSPCTQALCFFGTSERERTVGRFMTVLQVTEVSHGPAALWIGSFLFFILAFICFATAYMCMQQKKKRSQKKRASLLSTLLRKKALSITSFFVSIFLGIGLFLLVPTVFALSTGPQTHVYNGHLLDSSGDPITTAHAVRFSYWTSADYQTGDTTATGAVNTAASNYASWYEVHTVTPDSNGYFSVALGSGTSLPDLAAMNTSDLASLYLQVEVKASASADTAYELLDVNTLVPTIDRSPVLSVPFSLNADLLDQRDTGTASGSIPVIGSGGVFSESLIPNGLTRDLFTIDTDDSATTLISLQFGESLGKTLSWDIVNSRFSFNDDVYIDGDLTVTGLINGVDISSLASGSDQSQLKVSSGAGLQISIAAGTYRLNGNRTNYNGGSGIAVTDETTNYVFLGSGGLAVNTSGFPGDESVITLAEVVTTGGAITIIRDRRAFNTDDREQSIQRTLNPEFEGASYVGDGSNNIGQLSVQHDDTNKRNYYQWTSTRTSLQDYDVVIAIPVSADFVRWGSGSLKPITLDYRSSDASNTENQLDIEVYDTAGTQVTLSGSVTDLAGTSWNTTQIEFTGSPTWTVGEDLLIKIRMSAKDNAQMHLGRIQLNYVDYLKED